ncbi:putative conserved membrane protein [Synechococcus sp. A15-127]|uniref:hypothetical protein n=1 Tax=Synechococcus sp. A15-127 TaxID=1050624 RepID=UPI0016461983|nr:hypothetical protein [Synechococcus sp. A15-127]QNI93961.1 putative conserved membrane protein [Synechococcus sp. A15-127]
MAMLIALLTGALLITAATGLLIRQLTARKLSASESYQQMAEAAANNGFNRILATLNRGSTEEYRGFLFEVNNEPGSWSWENIYDKGEFCANRSALDTKIIRTVPLIDDTRGKETEWPRSSDFYPLGGDASRNTLRGDTKGTISTMYRLNQYTQNAGKAIFEVEGRVVRTTQSEGTSEATVLARARLTRSLQVESKVTRPEDWAVLAGYTINSSSTNPIKLLGPGIATHFVQAYDTSLCTDTKGISSNEVGQPQSVWPILRNISTDGGAVTYIPNSTIYSGDKTTDQVIVNGRKAQRIWSFDDSAERLTCKDDNNNTVQSIVCTRTGPNSNDQQIPTLKQLSDQGQSQDTTLRYTTFKKRRSRRKTYIQTGICKSDIILPEEECQSSQYMKGWRWNWEGKIYRSDNKPGDIITQWRINANTKRKEIGECTRVNAVDCDLADNNWRWRPFSTTSNSTSDTSLNTIRISRNDICPENTNSNVCHLYIEHLNLNNTEVYIENNGRPVVIHPYITTGNRRSDLVNNYQYSLKGSGKLCGVNAINIKDCNNKPQNLVITSENKSPTLGCSINDQTKNDFEFEGNSLPAAWFSMQSGRVRPKNANINGIIWVSAICPDGKLNLTTEGTNNEGKIEAYVLQGKSLWNWSDRAGLGRRVVRGIRGSGLDIFKRW